LNDSHKLPVGRVGRGVSRQALTTLSGILAEMGRIYRQARARKLDHEQARSLIWMLGQMRTAAEAIELERLHGRLDEMDATLTLESPNGYIARQVSPARIEGRGA